MKSLKEITDEKIGKYLAITKRAMDKAEILAPERSYARRIAEDFMKMASSYYSDALHFHKNGDYVNAFACVNYAHGWLDCGARLGIFDVKGDDVLFTLSE
ncbi:MAG: DUF357 domain-containing protein [Thermoplasmata archaeon HGW-Thermoplasmata-1]|nr:MAG: DUF357 domain-containing protein [Thermoplasmata archaeon HGW-Thermoplasmata-1]